MLGPALNQACEDYRRYLTAILEPAMVHLSAAIDGGPVQLHQVFGANLFLAHAVDYIQAIRKADGINERRSDLIRQFDTIFSVTGGRLRNRKFELIDAINNALKHIRIDPVRYSKLEEYYGKISFQSLVENNGQVLCVLNGYRFDFVRVVLRPAYRALSNWDFENPHEVLEFARGNMEVVEWSDEDLYSDDPSDAIDRMIHYCNPACDDCGEYESTCQCSEYVYDGEQGRFESRFRREFDFDGVMSQISGAYTNDQM